MAQEEPLSITLTTDATKIAACAKMMSETDPWLRYQLDYAYCLKAFDGECKEIYVMELENRVAGFAILQVCGSFKGYIQTICVHDMYRGRGYGKKLLQFCEERILKISPNIFICVSAFNKGAIKLYEEFGFTQIAELKDFLKEGVSELLLRKTYGPIVGYQSIKKSI
ncbi:MAG: GNAT family N-acetyltransferase [Bacteroidetes bacterium]|nr:GNAT family N-acetyltransferase [Bacteroidota bacterium]